MRSQTLGDAHLSSLSEHESRAHQLVPASDHSARTVPLVRIDLRDHPTSATEHERALTTRELALRAVAGWRRPNRPELPTTEAPRAGSSSGEPALPCRGRLAHRGHHFAPRPALGCATGAATNRAGRSLTAMPHGVRLGGTMRVHRVRIVRAKMAVPFSGRGGQPRVDSTTTVIVAGQRGVIMRGRRGSQYWPSTRRRTRTRSVARRPRRGRRHVDARSDEAMLALVRLLARQAAREVFAQTAMESDHSVEESRE
jgi:hypothetical protein